MIANELTVCTWRGDSHRQGYSLIAVIEHHSYFWAFKIYRTQTSLYDVSSSTHQCETVQEKPVKESM